MPINRAFSTRPAGARPICRRKNCWSVVKTIELEMGREPTFRYGPRAIDIDILLYGEVVIDQAELSSAARASARTRFCAGAAE